MVSRTAGAAAGLFAALLGGCTMITDSFLTNEFSGDPFPVHVDTSTGAILVGIHSAAWRAGDDRDAVLDLLSPITVIDSGPMTTPEVSSADLTLLGAVAPGSASRVARARFPDAQLVALHPCPDKLDDGAPNPDCLVGVPGATAHTFKGIVGADVLAGDAVRLRLGDDQIFVLADVAGSDRGRTLDCDAVFGSPYRGGGTLVLSGTELSFGNRRITLQACLGPDGAPAPGAPFDPDAFRQHGADALLVASTGIGISILGRAAYERYLAAVARDALVPAPLPFDQLTPDSVYLPSGMVMMGRRATVDRLALVAASTANALSPCRQLYAHRLLTTYKLTADDCEIEPGGASRIDCPCKNGELFCSVPGMVELTPPAGVGVDVLVVPDDDPTLQALRTELRPDQPEVDGILGTDILRRAEIDVDYPHDRLLARCPGGSCLARPALAQEDDLCPIARCLTGTQDPSGCSGLPEITPAAAP